MRRRMQPGLLAVAIIMAASALPAAGDASFRGLGHLRVGDDSGAYGVSADGSVVVGVSGIGHSLNVFRWTEGAGMQTLPVPPGQGVTAARAQVSADGSTVAATFFNPVTNWGGAYRWTAGGGFVSLGTLAGHTGVNASAFGISADGSVIVGQSINGDNNAEAFRWTAATGMSGLGFAVPGHPFGWAMDVTPDGSTVVGGSSDAEGSGNQQHFRWRQKTGMQLLSELPEAIYSRAVAASDDGSTVVGITVTRPGHGGGAYRWTEAGGMKLLRTPPPESKEIAQDVSGDGRMVVGNAEFGAFIWDPLNGMRPLRDVLAQEYGLGDALRGWSLGGASAISGDGRAIAGTGINPAGKPEAFLAILPEPSAAALLLGCVALLGRRTRRSDPSGWRRGPSLMGVSRNPSAP